MLAEANQSIWRSAERDSCPVGLFRHLWVPIVEKRRLKQSAPASASVKSVHRPPVQSSQSVVSWRSRVWQMIAHPVQSDPASCVRWSKVEAGSLSCGSFIVFLSPKRKWERVRDGEITIRESLHYASLWNIGPKHKIIEESNDNLPHIALESGKIDWSCMYRSGYISPTKCLRGLSQLLTYTSLSSVWFIELECKKPADAAYLRGIFLVFDVNAVPFLAWGRVQMTPA